MRFFWSFNIQTNLSGGNFSNDVSRIYKPRYNTALKTYKLLLGTINLAQSGMGVPEDPSRYFFHASAPPTFLIVVGWVRLWKLNAEQPLHNVIRINYYQCALRYFLRTVPGTVCCPINCAAKARVIILYRLKVPNKRILSINLIYELIFLCFDVFIIR